MNKNVFMTAALLICAASAIPSSVTAKNTKEIINASYKDIKLYIEGERVVLKDANGRIAEPFINDGTTYLPLRAVAGALSMEVEWDSEKNLVSLGKSSESKTHSAEEYEAYIGEKQLEITYRDISLEIDGTELTDSDGQVIEPFIIDGTTYLPLRAVAEATDTKVEWNGDTNSIYLTEIDKEISYKSTYDLLIGSDWTREEAENYGYTLDFETKAEQNYVMLVKYSGSEKNVLIPSKIDGKTVYILGKTADKPTELFTENNEIEYVSFENGVLAGSINYLFSDCKNLKGVYNIPRTTGLAATFRNCAKLGYVDGNFERVSSASAAFYGCKKLKSVPQMGTEVVNLDNAFENCEKLSGDIIIKSTKVIKATNFLHGTKNKINVSVPTPSVSYDTLSAENLEENVTLVETENRIAYLPREIDVASFTTLNLHNYAVTPEYKNYDIKWQCNIGNASEDKFTIAATEENIGKYPLTVTLSKDGREIYTAKSTVNIVSSKNISGKMVVTTIGDTYTVQDAWRKRVGRYTERIGFAGTRSSSHEGRIGANTGYYLEQFNYTSDSNGLEKNNPFFNSETNSFDWNYYKKYSELSPSGVQLFFQNHTVKTVDENIKNMRTMVDIIKQDDPNMRIFVVLPAYLASYNESLMIRNYEYVLALEEEFSADENVYFVPLNLTYDKNLNNAKNKTPNEEGYNQWGDCMYGTYAAVLSE